MDTKAAFDREAFAKEHGMTMEFVNWFFDKKAAGCGQVWFMMAAAMWEGWKESRTAIEIELPPFNQSHSCISSSCDSASAYRTDCSEVLTSHGIRIKGRQS